jgi:hypothetical protein
MTTALEGGWGVSVTPRPLFTPRKDPVPIVQEAGWAPGPVWTGAENLTPNRIRSPDRPARSQSLYRLRYPAHNKITEGEQNGTVHYTGNWIQLVYMPLWLLTLTVTVSSTLTKSYFSQILSCPLAFTYQNAWGHTPQYITLIRALS